MVTFEEQMARISQTENFVKTSNDASISTQNILYRNLYDSCLSDSRCNLDVYVAENNLDPNYLDASIIKPIKYNTLRETLAQREILLNAGYHLNDFDAQAAQESGDFGITFNNKKTQPLLNENNVNYSGISDSLMKLNLQTMTTSTVQNDSNNSHADPINPNNIINPDSLASAAKIAAIAIVAGVIGIAVIKGSKRK